MYRVIFRTCDKVNSVHNAPRPFGLDKLTLIKLCFASLKRSLEPFPHTIHAIADDLSPELTAFLQKQGVTLTEGKFGNDESLRQSLAVAMSYEDNDWVYLVEDDYLHTPGAFGWIDDLVTHTKDALYTRPHSKINRALFSSIYGHYYRLPLFIHPPDYPDRYLPKQRLPSMIFLSKSCHWREISNTTFTFLAKAGSFKKYRRILLKSTTGAQDGYLSDRLYSRFGGRRRALCVSPIPGIATHMHESTMTPLVNWETVLEEARSYLAKIE